MQSTDIQGTFEDCKEIYDSMSQVEKNWFGDHFIESPFLVYRRIFRIGNISAGFCEFVDAGKLPKGIEGDLVYSIAVKQEFRRMGIATKLTKDALNWFYKSNFTSITYRVKQDNFGSIALARSLNFTQLPQNILYKEIQKTEYVFIKEKSQ